MWVLVGSAASMTPRLLLLLPWLRAMVHQQLGTLEDLLELINIQQGYSVTVLEPRVQRRSQRS